jgi:hypothetical protein
MEHLWSRANANAREPHEERSVESCVTTCKPPRLVASARRGAEMARRRSSGSSRERAAYLANRRFLMGTESLDIEGPHDQVEEWDFHDSRIFAAVDGFYRDRKPLLPL